MDAARADGLAASDDPKALNALRNRGADPAVARAVAGQFGSFLMQGMMQDGDGSAMSMAGGTGGAAVSAMFAGAMSRYAMSGDKLGLADTIYRSMVAKGGPKPDAPQAHTNPSTANAGARVAAGAQPTAQTGGIALGPYWQLGGHRPFGPPIGHFAAPVGQTASRESADAAAATSRPVAATKVGAMAAVPTPAPSANAHATATATATGTQAPRDVASIHLHFLGRELVWPPLAEAATPHQVASTPKSASATPASGTAPAGVHPPAHEAFPWNILHLLGRNLGWASGSDGSRTASTGVAAAAGSSAPAAAPPIWPEPIHNDGTPATPKRNVIGQTLPHHPADESHNPNLVRAEDFAEELAPALSEAAARLGVSPRVLLAQAALETGWGHSVVGNNVFGIKAEGAWHGGVATTRTHEMEGGRLVARRAAFRSYASVTDAVDDYVTLVLASHRYRGAIGSGDDAASYGQVLAAGGYASDRDYAAKLAAVANSATMSYAASAAAEDAAADQRLTDHG